MRWWQCFVDSTIEDFLNEEQHNQLLELIKKDHGVLGATQNDLNFKPGEIHPGFNVTFSVQAIYPEYASAIAVRKFKSWSEKINVKSNIVHLEVMIQDD